MCCSSRTFCDEVLIVNVLFSPLCAACALKPAWQIIVPSQIGYPASDRGHKKVGPKPTTFSGKRALDFVLEVRSMLSVPNGVHHGAKDHSVLHPSLGYDFPIDLQQAKSEAPLLKVSLPIALARLQRT